jgi:photosynthetic reaction center H subunit
VEPQNLTNHYDLAIVSLYLFWLFFAGLIYYLQREAQREGYPVEESTRPGKFRLKSLMFYPPAKTFLLPDGTKKMAPDGVPDIRAIPGKATSILPGAPLEPNNAVPLNDCIGPGSWAERADKPDMTTHMTPRIVPMRVATSYAPDSRDPDPRGMPAVGCDGEIGGTVVDIWVDRSEALARYLEVETAKGKRRVLLPINFSVVKTSPGRVIVDAITGGQFENVPGTAKSDVVTLLEEDKVCAYYGSGTLYATPQRAEPLI